MKKKCLYAFLAIVAIAITSCGGGKTLKKPLTIKPIKTSLVADFDDDCKPENKDNAVANYMEIIDSEYAITPIEDGNKLRIDVNVKALKKAKESDEFRLSDYYACGRTYLFLIDDAGTRLMMSGTFLGSWDLVNFEAFKEFLTNSEETFMLRFEIYADYMAEHLKTPEKIKGFLVTCSGYKITNDNSGLSDSDVNVSGTSGGDKWDNLINSYASLMSQYFKLIRDDYAKQSDIDAVVEKSSAIKTQLQDAENDLSQAQWKRFIDLEKKWEADLEKFMNED